MQAKRHEFLKYRTKLVMLSYKLKSGHPAEQTGHITHATDDFILFKDTSSRGERMIKIININEVKEL